MRGRLGRTRALAKDAPTLLPPLPAAPFGIHLSIHGLVQRREEGLDIKPCSGVLQSWDLAPCQQAYSKRAPRNQLCKKERELIVFSTLLSTTSLTAALWQNVALQPAPCGISMPCCGPRMLHTKYLALCI